jgi:hypothetical protein
MFVALHVRVLWPVVGALGERNPARERERCGGGERQESPCHVVFSQIEVSPAFGVAMSANNKRARPAIRWLVRQGLRTIADLSGPTNPKWVISRRTHAEQINVRYEGNPSKLTVSGFQR